MLSACLCTYVTSVLFMPSAHSHTSSSNSICIFAAGSQISQKIKSTYKTSTSRIANTFKPSSGCGTFVKSFVGHTDGVWEVSVSKYGPKVIGTASAGTLIVLGQWCLLGIGFEIDYSYSIIRVSILQELQLSVSHCYSWLIDYKGLWILEQQAAEQ